MPWERDVPLADRTRYRIGGPTPRFGRARDREELAGMVEEVGGAGYRMLGGGANLLVADCGVPEPVLQLGEGFDTIRVGEEAMQVGAAARLPAVAGAARRNAVRGYVFLEAVPGTVGGGLRMNAGSTETWLWHRVIRAEAMTPDGETVELTPAEAGPAYRSVDVPDAWIFLAARLEAERGDPEAIDRMRRQSVPCLPVVQDEDGRLVGMVTEHDFLNIAGQLLEGQLRDSGDD